MNFKSLKLAALGLIGFSLIASESGLTNGVYSYGNHYTSYNLSAAQNSLPFRSSVLLRDQFIGNNGLTFNLGRARWLLTPTIKIDQNKEVFRPDNFSIHYVGYPVNTSSPHFYDFTVNVYNQFGYFTLNAFEPEYLLVPSFKKRIAQQPFNPNLTIPTTFAGEIDSFADQISLSNYNHYLCYKTNVQSTYSNIFGRLFDQFHPTAPRGYYNLQTAHLCNPVTKSHDGQTYEIVDSEEHLLCFDFREKFGYNRPFVGLSNQFGRGIGAVYSDDEICVPSSKQIAPQDLCEDSLSNNGTCNGACLTPNNVCVSNGNTGRCHCVVGP